MTKTFPDELKWDRYLSAPVGPSTCSECQRAFSAAFGRQREIIRQLMRDLRPGRVGCLGSGYLTDIPLAMIVEEGMEGYLVDWIEGISVEGVRGIVISEHEGKSACLFCSLPSPPTFCKAFREPIREPHLLCDAYAPLSKDNAACEHYSPGDQPNFVRHDITCGRASRFAERMWNIVLTATSPQQAFHKATVVCRQCEMFNDVIPVESGSLDLVTSSMVVSQFDHEPYAYFSRLLETRFGHEAVTERAKRLRPLMDGLRRELFRVQMEGHAAEMYRLVNKEHGKVFFSVELFRSVEKSEDFFLVHEIPQALDILGRRFHFDFQSLPVDQCLRNASVGGGTSIMLSAVLTPMQDLEPGVTT